MLLVGKQVGPIGVIARKIAEGEHKHKVENCVIAIQKEKPNHAILNHVNPEDLKRWPRKNSSVYVLMSVKKEQIGQVPSITVPTIPSDPKVVPEGLPDSMPIEMNSRK